MGTEDIHKAVEVDNILVEDIQHILRRGNTRKEVDYNHIGVVAEVFAVIFKA